MRSPPSRPGEPRHASSSSTGRWVVTGASGTLGAVAEEDGGRVRANAITPGVIDTPTDRETTPGADRETWVDPADVAQVPFLRSDAASPTSGAAVPAYGEA